MDRMSRLDLREEKNSKLKNTAINYVTIKHRNK